VGWLRHQPPGPPSQKPSIRTCILAAHSTAADNVRHEICNWLLKLSGFQHEWPCDVNSVLCCRLWQADSSELVTPPWHAFQVRQVVNKCLTHTVKQPPNTLPVDYRRLNGNYCHTRYITSELFRVSWVEQGLTSHQTHYRSYRGRVFTVQMAQPTVSKHWRKTQD